MIRGSAAFLIAMLWMDLIFDTQVLRHRRADELPEPMLASIAGYYHRANTTSRPMSLLIVLTMPILLGTLGFRAFHRADHLVCLLLMSSFLAVWVVAAASRRFETAARSRFRHFARSPRSFDADLAAGMPVM